MDVKWTATALAGGGRGVRRRRDAPLGFGQAGAHVLPRRNVGPAEPGRGWSAVASRGGAPHQVEADRVELQHRGVRGGGATSVEAAAARRRGGRRGRGGRWRRVVAGGGAGGSCGVLRGGSDGGGRSAG
ncbi:unnamed protein product [Miscanthus lutarioriparius]|uniref:Uncharacterized protein n=1 Tax=Miscanthus lutarioriparius TaxID=422564 RepID=A0A811SJ69_9POAL|nr:unnamed protein product [Miscanthus lutarioriparius]